MKTCTKCGKTLPLAAFGKQSTGRGGLRANCRTCATRHSKEWASQNREAYNAAQRKYTRKRRLAQGEKFLAANRIRAKKRRIRRTTFLRTIQSGGCVCCGEKRYTCLDFHHIDPSTKKAYIAKLANIVALARELIKCVVVCANCHRLIHTGEIQLPKGTKTISIPNPEQYDLRRST